MSRWISPLKKIGDALERMSQRERMMVGLLGLTFTLCVLLLGGYLVRSGLDDLEDRNDAMRQALRDIDRKRAAYLQARARMAALEARIGIVPLQLSGFLEQTAKETGIEIRETNPRPPENVGKKYVQQSMDVRLGKVALEPLLKFMRKLEQNPTNLVLVTALSIHNLDDKHVDFEVNMTVSTYEHAPKKPKAKDEGAGAEKEPS